MGELLAKPDVLLIDHLKDVLRLGNDVAHRLGLDERLRTKALLACVLHDIGKATIDFQEYMRGKRGKAYPHALASLPFILIAENKLNCYHNWYIYELTATASVLTHHSPLSPNLYRGFTTPKFHPYLDKILEEIWGLLKCYEISGLPSAQDFLNFLSPLLANSPAAILDDISIDPQTTLRGRLQSLPVHEFAQVKTVLHLSDWLVSGSKNGSTVLFLDKGEDLVELGTKHLALRSFQQKAEAIRGKNLQLRAPTGTGKTEALLLWAGDTERLIYLLPTQATVNAMWRRLRQIYGDNRVSLAHGRASYILHSETEEDPLELRLFGSVFAKPVTVATLDQYLIAHLNGRHWEERRCLAQQATIILDEIHAYEPYTLGLLSRALDKERPARLALASATLPSMLLEFFPQGELVEAEDPLWQRTRHRLELRDDSLHNSLENIISFARDSKKVLVVANTIHEAQMLYQTLREGYNWEKTHLLHSRFTFRDRQEKEARVGDPPPGTIFISTQVVEVSLDISYDVLLTELAPLDALVQRMGRVNRRGERFAAPVIICCQYSGGSQKIYGREILERSLDILKSLPEIPTDRDLANATDRLYRHVMLSEDWKKEFHEGGQTLEEVQQILGCYTIDLSDESMREKFTTRRGQISINVLHESLLQEAYKLREQGEPWRIVELLISVPIWWLSKFSEWFYPCSDLKYFGTNLPYDSKVGLLPPNSDEFTESNSSLGIIK